MQVEFDPRTDAKMVVSGDLYTLTPDHVQQIAEIALRDMQNYGPLERTFVEGELGGLPTTLARVDCTVDEFGNIIHYETEERPAGLGIVERMSDALGIPDDQNPSRLALTHLEDTFGSLPVSLIEYGSPPNDDGLVLQQKGLNEIYRLDPYVPVLVRANPATVERSVGGLDNLRKLQEQSVSTVATEGLKHYRIVNDDAQRFDPNCLPNRNFPFVGKPIQGSKANGLVVYIPKTHEDGRYSQMLDISSYKRAIETMDGSTSEYIVEPFHPGIPVTIDGLAAVGILRVYVALSYEKISKEYTARVLGGAIVARPGLLVHGRSDAIGGVVLAPEFVIQIERSTL